VRCHAARFGQIQEEDAAYVSKKRAKQGLPPVEPLYTIEDAERSLNSLSAWATTGRCTSRLALP